MAVAAVLAAALTNHAARSRGLYVGGVDVTFEPGSGGNRYGVAIESIVVTESGPGGVSSMTFTIDDPLIEVAIEDGLGVRYEDLGRETTTFLGFVQAFSIEPGFGGQGRTIRVTAVGVEAVLDWAKVATTLVYDPAGAILYSLNDVIQGIVANAVGLGPIRALSGYGAINSNQEGPIVSGLGPVSSLLTIPAGTTVREAIRLAWQSLGFGIGSIGAQDLMWTVDFTYGLRVWTTSPLGLERPDDYGTETIVDTALSAAVAESLSYAWDAAGVVRGVIVIGTGVTVTVGDGSGKPGLIATLRDPALTTAAMATSAGVAYLNGFSPTVRGSYSRTDREPDAAIHAGGRVVISDTAAGLSTKPLRIMQVRKTFNGSNREDWTIAFGGLPPSGAALIRRLTRDTLS